MLEAPKHHIRNRSQTREQRGKRHSSPRIGCRRRDLIREHQRAMVALHDVVKHPAQPAAPRFAVTVGFGSRDAARVLAIAAE